MCSKSLCWLDGSLRLKELGLKLSEGCKCSEFFGCIVVSYKYTLWLRTEWLNMAIPGVSFCFAANGQKHKKEWHHIDMLSLLLLYPLVQPCLVDSWLIFMLYFIWFHLVSLSIAWWICMVSFYIWFHPTVTDVFVSLYRGSLRLVATSLSRAALDRQPGATKATAHWKSWEFDVSEYQLLCWWQGAVVPNWYLEICSFLLFCIKNAPNITSSKDGKT